MIEMLSRRWSHLLAAFGIALAALFVLANGLGVARAQPPGPILTSTDSGSSATLAPATTAVTQVVLFDQTGNAASSAITSQDFEAINDVSDDQAADDFVVPAGQVWGIEQVEVFGQYFAGTGPAQAVNVFFYSHAITVPGNLLAARTGLTFTNGANFTVVFTEPVMLTAGTYWISVQAVMDLTPYGQWGWNERTVQSGFASAWRNPGGGFGPNCVNWKGRVADCAIGSQPDLLFRLSGFPANDVLYSQTTFSGPSATTSQDFETINDAFDNQSADDFVVPAGQVWVIDRVEAPGQYFGGPGPAQAVNVFFYSHAITVPGNLLAARTGLTFTNGANFDVALPTPVILTAGTYWISVQALMNLSPNGQWGWSERTIQSGFASAWRNPGGGFGPNCLNWKRRVADCAIGSQPDHIFRLHGHAVPNLYLPLATR